MTFINRETIMSVFDKFTDHLVDNWKDAWKWTSVQVSGLSTLVVTYFMTYPDEYSKIVDSLPERYRIFVGPLAGMFFLYVRLRRQGTSSTN